MRCVICRHGETRPGTADVTLQRNTSVIVVWAVPADICENCQEYFLSDEVSERVLSQAESAVQRGAEVEIVRYAA
jgi:YgiT-type zinc finger domain-containing protein